MSIGCQFDFAIRSQPCIPPVRSLLMWGHAVCWRDSSLSIQLYSFDLLLSDNFLQGAQLTLALMFFVYFFIKIHDKFQLALWGCQAIANAAAGVFAAYGLVAVSKLRKHMILIVKSKTWALFKLSEPDWIIPFYWSNCIYGCLWNMGRGEDNLVILGKSTVMAFPDFNC